jgi:hypothetical protein
MRLRSRIVGPALGQVCEHPLDGRCIVAFSPEPEYAGDSTHAAQAGRGG